MPPEERTYEFVQIHRMLPCGVKSTMGLKLPDSMTHDEAKLWVRASKFSKTHWEFQHVSTVDTRVGKP